MIEGVAANIAPIVEEVGANVVTESNLLLRTCEHGVRHPVGHLDGSQWVRLLSEWTGPRQLNKLGAPIPSTLEARHEIKDGAWHTTNAVCCGCCPHGAQ